jgi:cytochrome P450 family 135
MSNRRSLPPGPRLPSLLQTLWYTFDQPRFFARARKRFGNTWTVRLPGFPPGVVTSDRDAIRRLLTGDPLTRRHANDLLRRFLGDRSLLLLEPADHLARRRLELPPFHGDAVRGYADRIRELADDKLGTWRAGEVVATHPHARALTLEVILELVLGVRDRALQTELGAIFEWFNTPLGNLALFLPEALTRRSGNLLTRKAYRQLDRLHGLLGEHIARSRIDPALDERTDVLSRFIRARDEGAQLTDADLRDELLTLVSAGHETTATAIAWAGDLLAHNPGVAQRLREERDGSYLRATAKEVLRARTVAYISASRHPLEPFELGEWVLAPEVAILVDAQGLHANPELFEDPGAFRPERFIEHPPDAYAYLPFGGGAHRCLGAALAMLELELFIDALVNRVELAPDGPPARPVRRGVTLAPGNGGRVRVRRVRVPPLAAAA